MSKQFDSCSYDELTRCVKARIKWLRELNEFRSNPISFEYNYLRFQAVIQTLKLKTEIRKLLKMRRILKSSELKNWDSDYLGDVK